MPEFDWRRRDTDGAYVCASTGYVILRDAPDRWTGCRSETEPLPGFNVFSRLGYAQRACERDLYIRQGEPPRLTRVVMSVGDPGKWQAQYHDRHSGLWFDIGDAQADRAQAESREHDYRVRQARLTGGPVPVPAGAVRVELVLTEHEHGVLRELLHTDLSRSEREGTLGTPWHRAVERIDNAVCGHE